MGKNKKKPDAPIQMVSRRQSPEQILQKANQLKDAFSTTKGKTDQMLADALSHGMTGMLNMIQNLLAERMQDAEKIKLLEAKILNLTPKGAPKPMNPEIPDPDAEASVAEATPVEAPETVPKEPEITA